MIMTKIISKHTCSSDFSAEGCIYRQLTVLRVKHFQIMKSRSHEINFKAIFWPPTLSKSHPPPHFITHLYLLLANRQRSWEKRKAPELCLWIVELVCNKGGEVLPWKPSRNLEPSGRSSGVYSLYPPTKSWSKTLRPTKGPGENPALFRCPSTWGRYKRQYLSWSLSSVGVRDGAQGAQFI